MEILKGFRGIWKVLNGLPQIFIISPLISSPPNKVSDAFPMALTILFTVQDCSNFVFCFPVNFHQGWWRLLLVGEFIGVRWFKEFNV